MFVRRADLDGKKVDHVLQRRKVLCLEKINV